MSNDTTNDLPATSIEPEKGGATVVLADEIVHLAASGAAGFEMDVVHEPDAAYLVFRLRLPKSGALPALIDMLTQKSGSGFYRVPPPASDD